MSSFFDESIITPDKKEGSKQFYRVNINKICDVLKQSIQKENPDFKLLYGLNDSGGSEIEYDNYPLPKPPDDV